VEERSDVVLIKFPTLYTENQMALWLHFPSGPENGSLSPFLNFPGGGGTIQPVIDLNSPCGDREIKIVSP
jgi:hypothetical protein